jgi:hypothetical protein
MRATSAAAAARAIAARQRLKRLDSRSAIARTDNANSGRRKFIAKRDAIEPMADVDDRLRTLVRHAKRRNDGGRPVEEETHGFVLGNPRRRYV